MLGLDIRYSKEAFDPFAECGDSDTPNSLDWDGENSLRERGKEISKC